MYCAIIGDIINSKMLKNRNDTQVALDKILSDINREYYNDIASKFTITLGDEFQGLLYYPDNMIKILDIIRFQIYPVKLRIGIGIGEIQTEINRNLSIGADGPAYYNARKAIDFIKKSKSKKQQPDHGLRIEVGNYVDFPQELINATLALCYSLENKWTDKQRETIKELVKDKENQSEIAQKLKINQSTIQRRIKAANFYAYNYAKETVTSSIQKKWRILND